MKNFHIIFHTQRLYNQQKILVVEIAFSILFDSCAPECMRKWHKLEIELLFILFNLL